MVAPDQIFSYFVQECLTNIHRHSGSKKASIYLLRDAENVVLEAKDQGIGIARERLAEIEKRKLKMNRTTIWIETT